MKHENLKVNSTFLSCDGVQIGCVGNNIQGQKRSYENRGQSGVEEMIPTERRKKTKACMYLLRLRVPKFVIYTKINLLDYRSKLLLEMMRDELQNNKYIHRVQLRKKMMTINLFFR